MHRLSVAGSTEELAVGAEGQGPDTDVPAHKQTLDQRRGETYFGSGTV